MTKRVIQAFKCVYDFIVFCGCEIGKHNFTIKVWIWKKANKLWKQYWRIFGLYKPKLVERAKSNAMTKIWQACLFTFLAVFVFNLVYILLREKFGLKGCVLCDEV